MVGADAACAGCRVDAQPHGEPSVAEAAGVATPRDVGLVLPTASSAGTIHEEHVFEGSKTRTPRSRTPSSHEDTPCGGRLNLSIDIPTQASQEIGFSPTAVPPGRPLSAPPSRWILKPSYAERSVYSRKANYYLNHQFTEVCMALVIFVNFILIIKDTDLRAAGEFIPRWMEVAGHVCFAVYTMEYAVRFFVELWGILDGFWGQLDTVIIVVGFVELGIEASGADMASVTLLRAIRLARLLRLLRAMKVFSALRELRKLLQMMLSCARTLVWSFMICFMVMTMWAVAAVELVHPLVTNLSTSNAGMWADCERCPRAFSSVWSANLTFFQTIVAGDSWGLIAVPVAEAYPWTVIILMGALITMIFGVLNLIVAVIVDTFAENRARDVASIAEEMDLEEVLEKRSLAKIFSLIDEDQNGMITFEELKEGAERVEELRNWLRVMDVDGEDLYQLFRMVDHEACGSIDPNLFVEALYKLRHTESRTAARLMKHNINLLCTKMQDMDDKIQQVTSSFALSSQRGSPTSRSPLAWLQRSSRPPPQAPTPTPTALQGVDRKAGVEEKKQDRFEGWSTTRTPSSGRRTPRSPANGFPRSPAYGGGKKDDYGGGLAEREVHLWLAQEMDKQQDELRRIVELVLEKSLRVATEAATHAATQTMRDVMAIAAKSSGKLAQSATSRSSILAADGLAAEGVTGSQLRAWIRQATNESNLSHRSGFSFAELPPLSPTVGRTKERSPKDVDEGRRPPPALTFLDRTVDRSMLRSGNVVRASSADANNSTADAVSHHGNCGVAVGAGGRFQRIGGRDVASKSIFHCDAAGDTHDGTSPGDRSPDGGDTWCDTGSSSCRAGSDPNSSAGSGPSAPATKDETFPLRSRGGAGQSRQHSSVSTPQYICVL